MIELNTGIPGSGKTLAMVARLREIQARWEKHPKESRPVFVNGIRDLKLPHAPVPLKPVQLTKAGKVTNVPDWELIPDGSLVILDECQDQFPPRSTGSTIPDHVAFLNTHRHKGLDIWMTTQHPKLIDTSCRALVGQHRHYRRIFGMKRSICYEWDACSDSLSGMASAVKSYFNYPKNVFELYKSAEVHTKQKFKIPLWVFVPLIGLALGVYAWPKMYGTLSNGMSGKGIKSESSGLITGSTGGPAPVAPLHNAAFSFPDSVPRIERKAVLISACLATVSRCQCYDYHGVKLRLPESVCRESAESVTENFRFEEEAQRVPAVDSSASRDSFNRSLNRS